MYSASNKNIDNLFLPTPTPLPGGEVIRFYKEY